MGSKQVKVLTDFSDQKSPPYTFMGFCMNGMCWDFVIRANTEKDFLIPGNLRCCNDGFWGSEMKQEL